MEGYIAEIRYFAGNFAPRNWAFCDGSIQSIAQNTALFSLLGTTYGGNGQTTFALPDLRGRVAVGVGQSQGTSLYYEGEMTGNNAVTMLQSNLPSHNHPITAAQVNLGSNSGSGTTTSSPLGAVFAPANNDDFSDTTTPNAHFAPMSLNLYAAPAGGGYPIDVMQPYLGMNYVICCYGIFPSRG